MEIGDLIYDSHFKQCGIVVLAEHMLTEDGDWCSILYEDDSIVKGIRSWEETIEVINENR